MPLRQVRAARRAARTTARPLRRTTGSSIEGFPATGQVYRTAGSALPGLAGESRSGDANGQWARVVAGNGLNVYAIGGVDTQLGQRFGISNFPIMGVNPPKANRPPSRYDVPCETQELPDLRTTPGPAPQQVSRGQFTPLQAALNQANQFEGVAGALGNEGKSKLAASWYAKAKAIRVQHGLLGKQWDLQGTKLTIVDTKSKELTRGGAPVVAPALLHGRSAETVKVLQQRFAGRLSGITGRVNAKKGGSG